MAKTPKKTPSRRHRSRNIARSILTPSRDWPSVLFGNRPARITPDVRERGRRAFHVNRSVRLYNEEAAQWRLMTPSQIAEAQGIPEHGESSRMGAARNSGRYGLAGSESSSHGSGGSTPSIVPSYATVVGPVSAASSVDLEDTFMADFATPNNQNPPPSSGSTSSSSGSLPLASSPLTSAMSSVHFGESARGFDPNLQNQSDLTALARLMRHVDLAATPDVPVAPVLDPLSARDLPQRLKGRAGGAKISALIKEGQRAQTDALLGAPVGQPGQLDQWRELARSRTIQLQNSSRNYQVVYS